MLSARVCDALAIADKNGSGGGSSDLTYALAEAPHLAGTMDADAAEAGGFRIRVSEAASIHTVDGDVDRMVRGMVLLKGEGEVRALGVIHRVALSR